MTEWYRRKTWTKEDEGMFFAKLERAREYRRAQYLRIQALELIQTKDKKLLEIAEFLLNKLLRDYPENQLERSPTLNTLGEISKLKGEYDSALDYFHTALEFESNFPNVITTAYLNFSETVILSGKVSLYNDVEKILLRKIDAETILFPAANYIIYSALSVIADYRGETSIAIAYAEIAEKNATAKNNNLWNPKKQDYGIVTARKNWLDRLVGKK